MINHLRKTFLSGLILILPLWVTLGLIVFIIKKLTAFVAPWIQSATGDHLTPPTLYLLSLTASLLLIYLMGLMGRNIVGRYLVGNIENLFMRVPVVKTVYASTKQILQAVSSNQKKTFQKVVMLEYPRKGIRSIAFVTNQLGPYLSIFIPTTPNPTSGWLALVKEEDCTNLDITPDEAIRLIISGGIIVPEQFTLDSYNSS